MKIVIKQLAFMNRKGPLLIAQKVSWAVVMLLLFCAAAAPLATAQRSAQDLGVPPFTAALPVEKGFINTANGNLHLEIPLGYFPQRGGSQQTITLTYDSSIWSTDWGWSGQFWDPNNFYLPANVAYPSPMTAGGWKVVMSPDSGSITAAETDYGDCTVPDYGDIVWMNIYSPFYYTEPNGKTHVFSSVSTTVNMDPTDCPGTSNATSSGYADDGSGYYISVTGYTNTTVYTPDGTAIYSLNMNGGPDLVRTDPNGNKYTSAWYSGGMRFYDTLNRAVATITSSTDGNTYYIAIPNSQGSTTTFTAHLSTVNVYSNFGVSGIVDETGSFKAITELDLPDGTDYAFSYDSGTSAGHYGQLTQMTLPTGGSINYGYANYSDVYGNMSRWVSQRTTPDSATPWTYAPSFSGSSCSGGTFNCQQTLRATKPSGDYSVYTFTFNDDGSLGTVPWLTLAQDYDSSSNLLASTSACYTFVTLSSGTCSYSPTSTYAGVPVFKTSETTTLPKPSGSVSKTTEYSWDSSNNGNMIQMAEWNFGSSPSGSADRTTAYTYYSNGYVIDRPGTITVTNSSGGLVAKRVNSYDGSTLATSGATGIAQHDDTNYGSGFTARGNLTQVQQYTSSSSYVTSSMTYDITGQMRTSTDANGNVTLSSYTDNFFNDAGDSSSPSGYTPSTATNAYLTSETRGYGTSAAETFTSGYYFGTGQMAESTDPNSQTTYSHFYDSLNRPTSTKFPDSGWNLSVYSGSETQVDFGTGITSATLSTTCSTSGNACRHDQTILDSLGRVVDQNLVSDPSGETTVATAYDSNGRVQKTSNPYRSTSDPTYGWTTPTYDGLDRVKQTHAPDGGVSYVYYGSNVGTGGGAASQLCSSSSYGAGFPILKVDEAGKKLQSWIDGFGRLIEADEPNSSGTMSVNTCYSYDLNNNLTGVLSAGGTQTRSFSYDLLSRLTSATNPESGTTSYTYDADGNVTYKTDARSITEGYVYDALNRLLEKYATGMPTIYYLYDQTSANGISLSYSVGRRTWEGTNDGTGWLTQSVFNHDKMGRVILDQSIENGVTETTDYTYNLDGSLATLAYPSGQTITYTPTSAEQMVSAVDAANGINYATGATYTPAGSLASLMNDSTLLSSLYYNSRLQPCRIAVNSSGTPPSSCASTNNGNVFDLSYNFSLGSSDNGNVIGVTNNIDTTRSQAYSYDTLNRLSTAETTSTYSTSPSHCWGESYTVDALANLSAITPITSGYSGCTQESGLSLSIGTNNRITNTGFTYDSAGNVTGDGSHTYTYDAENRLIQVDGTSGTCSTATECYVYDAEGQRVEKATSSASKLYWYDTSGGVLDETDGSGNVANEYVFFGGKRIAINVIGSGRYYYAQDMLGSSRTMVLAGSTTSCYDADYYPYGGERAYTNSCSQNYKFTGKERDSESNLDNFGARYDSSSTGRFMSPDWSVEPQGVPYAVLDNPQTLNLYAYARNNPVAFSDPDGHCPKALDFLCNAFGNTVQRFDNEFHGLGFNTNQQVETLHHDAGVYFREHGISTEDLTYKGMIKSYQDDKKRNPASYVPNFFAATATVGISSQSIILVPRTHNMYYSPGPGFGDGASLTAGWATDPDRFAGGASGNLCGFYGVGGCGGVSGSGDGAFQLGLGFGGWGGSAGYGVDFLQSLEQGMYRGTPPDPLATVPAGGLDWEDPQPPYAPPMN